MGLRSRLEKQPTDLAAARQNTAYFGDRTREQELSAYQLALTLTLALLTPMLRRLCALRSQQSQLAGCLFRKVTRRSDQVFFRVTLGR
jgi:hypothetical protein